MHLFHQLLPVPRSLQTWTSRSWGALDLIVRVICGTFPHRNKPGPSCNTYRHKWPYSDPLPLTLPAMTLESFCEAHLRDSSERLNFQLQCWAVPCVKIHTALSCGCIIHGYQKQIITWCRPHNTHPKLHVLVSGSSPANFTSLSLMHWATTSRCQNLWKAKSIFSCIFCYKNMSSRAVIFMPSFKVEWLYTVKLQPSKMWIYNTYNGSPVTITFQMWHSYKC